VGAIARLDEAAREKLLAGARRVEEIPDGPARRAIARFLEAYGDRGTPEAELGVPRWGEDPRPVLDMLAAGLRGEPVDPDASLSRARALADRQLALLEPSLSFFETRVVRDIVSRQRALLRLRERCRSRVAHGMAMMRIVALDVDRRIRRLDPSLESGSALMLTMSELSSAVSKYRADLAPIVRARRADLDVVRRTASPPPVFRGAPAAAYRARTEPILSGLAASSGAADGKVVRLGTALEGIERFSPGDVLVLRSFDLGLAPLFVQAKAIVSELGTPFSSSAVVARDYGVPAVTGVPYAWTLLREGERVRVDGDAATVESLGT
jgi:pyruvate,water dikinase